VSSCRSSGAALVRGGQLDAEAVEVGRVRRVAALREAGRELADVVGDAEHLHPDDHAGAGRAGAGEEAAVDVFRSDHQGLV
jgi:hypothetical protein